MTKTLVQHARVRTNTVKESVCKIDVPAVKFTDLWQNYVTGDPYRDPKTGEVPPGLGNQCALRMSATFHKVGIKMLSFSPKTVKPAPGSQNLGVVKLDGLPAATRAYELGQWLKLQPFCGCHRQGLGKKVNERTGIIMFHAYWTRAGESTANASGGHIDLWNGSRLTISGFFDAFATMGRFVGRPSFFPGTDYGWSDLANSKLILFWDVK
jgi:hypothetical protein